MRQVQQVERTVDLNKLFLSLFLIETKIQQYKQKFPLLCSLIQMIEKENHHNFVSMTLTLRFSIGYF
jgi:CII-binding regulator of phage lambda lysogenization HflD